MTSMRLRDVLQPHTVKLIEAEAKVENIIIFWIQHLLKKGLYSVENGESPSFQIPI